MPCRTCTHLSSDKHMSPQGFNLCALGPKWKFWPLRHSCPKWQQEEPAKLEKRLAWLRKRGLEGK